MHLNLVCKSERKLGASTASALGLRASQLYLRFCAEDHKLLYREHWRSRTGDSAPVGPCFGPVQPTDGDSQRSVVVMSELLQGRGARARFFAHSAARAWAAFPRSPLRLRKPIGGGAGGVSSCEVSHRTQLPRPTRPRRGLGCELAARHCPQFRQIVVPPAGSAAGHRMDGMLACPSRDQATCSVSCAQPEQ